MSFEKESIVGITFSWAVVGSCVPKVSLFCSDTVFIDEVY